MITFDRTNILLLQPKIRNVKLEICKVKVLCIASYLTTTTKKHTDHAPIKISNYSEKFNLSNEIND